VLDDGVVVPAACEGGREAKPNNVAPTRRGTTARAAATGAMALACMLTVTNT
jgi:hypothetical protein